jgi:gas vesicle protein
VRATLLKDNIMKNPLQKNNYTPLIVAAAIVSVAAGAAAFLFLTDSGNEARKSLKKKIKKIAKDAAVDAISKKTKIKKKAVKAAANHIGN